MHRQIETGHPYTMMLEQYRMHPHISRLGNMLIYNNRLINNPCAFDRDDADLFDRWSKVIAYDGGCQALFCEVPDPELDIERDRLSKLDPTYGHKCGAHTVIETPGLVRSPCHSVTCHKADSPGWRS